MSKRSKRRRDKQKQPHASPEALRQQGAQAFRRGDYEMAIAAWRRISHTQRDANLTAAFAEACFRRGLGGHLDSLRQAATLVADEPRYVYHLALAHHRAGRLKEAEPLYRQTLNLARADDEIGPRAAYTLGVLLLETQRSPGRDPLWKRWKQSSGDPAWAETCQRLTWAEHMTSGRPAPAGPAPDSLWEKLAARTNRQADSTPLDPAGLTRMAAAVAHCHLAARAWERDDAERAYVHWRVAHSAGLDFPQLRDNLFAAARTVATERLKANDAPGALEAATVGLTVYPDDSALKTIAGQAHFHLGRVAATAGQWDKAYRHWQDALQIGGERNRRLVINLALAEEQRENWIEAAELWREALRRRPRKADHPDALDDAQVARLWRHVSESYYRSGWAGEALDTFRNALKWAPDDTALRTAYVDLLMDDGRIWAADNQLTILLEAQPNDVELLERQAQLYAGQGYTFAAINVWKKIIEVQADHPGAARQLARQYERLGDNHYHWGWLEQAQEAYQQGLTYAPDDGMLLASMGMCHVDMKQEQAAQQLFERACTAEPGNPSVYLLIIKSWLDHNYEAAAQASLQRAREAIELSPAFFLDLAEFCYNLGRLAPANEFIAQARTLAASDVRVLLLIADMVGRNRNFALAQEIAEDVLKLEPDNPLAHLLLGLALVSQGNLKAARHSWKRAEKIAQETNNEAILLAVAEMRMLYDPRHGPPLDLLMRMMGRAMFQNDDDDKEWF